MIRFWRKHFFSNGENVKQKKTQKLIWNEKTKWFKFFLTFFKKSQTKSETQTFEYDSSFFFFGLSQWHPTVPITTIVTMHCQMDQNQSHCFSNICLMLDLKTLQMAFCSLFLQMVMHSSLHWMTNQKIHLLWNHCLLQPPTITTTNQSKVCWFFLFIYQYLFFFQIKWNNFENSIDKC